MPLLDPHDPRYRHLRKHHLVRQDLAQPPVEHLLRLGQRARLLEGIALRLRRGAHGGSQDRQDDDDPDDDGQRDDE